MLAKSDARVVVTLPSDREICFTRLFDWPPELLFDAWTRPEHLRHWWGCATATVTNCEVDLRLGGRWVIEMRMQDASEHRFRGVYCEIVKPQRLVYTECYDMPAFGCPEWLTTVTFEEVGSKTLLKNILLHNSLEARNGHLQSGMESGMIHAFERLAEVIESTQLVQGPDK